MATELRPLGPDLLEQAFDLATRVFIEGSTLHRALGITLTDYQRYLRRPFEMMVGEGHSIAATDVESGQVTGCLIVTDFANQMTRDPASDAMFAPLAALTGELVRQYRLKQEARSGEVVLVDMGAVRPNVRGQGIYRQMRVEAHEQARRRGFRTVVGELSSMATQHLVLKRLGHAKVAEVVFGDFECCGTRPFAGIVDPPSIVLAAGKL